MTTALRNREHEVADIFVNRWSPRAFTGEEIPDKTLFSLFEAARWAPSSYNSQPWLFLYAKRGTRWFDTFQGVLNARNQTWAKNAAVLIVLASKTTMVPPGRTEAVPARHHSFDTGAAWANFANQAVLSGWHAHAMAGFDAERARTDLHVPPEYHIDVAIAVGRRGDKSILPETFHAGESPSGRKPLTEVIREGAFPAP